MFGLAFQIGIADGLLESSLQPAVDRAWQATSRRIADGLLSGVSSGTPPGDAKHYAAVTTGSGFPWGQGPALSFALEA